MNITGVFSHRAASFGADRLESESLVQDIVQQAIALSMKKDNVSLIIDGAEIVIPAKAFKCDPGILMERVYTALKQAAAASDDALDISNLKWPETNPDISTAPKALAFGK